MAVKPQILPVGEVLPAFGSQVPMDKTPLRQKLEALECKKGICMVKRLLKMSVAVAVTTLATGLVIDGPISKVAHAGNVVVNLEDDGTVVALEGAPSSGASKLLVINGSADADVISVSRRGNELIVQGGRGTTVNGAKSAKFAYPTLSYLGIYTNEGKDEVTLKNLTSDCDVQVDLGVGNDDLSVSGAKLLGLTIVGSDGSDKCSIQDSEIVGRMYVWGFYPWDPLPIEGDGGIGNTVVDGRFAYASGGIRFEGWNGDDTLNVRDVKASSVWFYGGAGNDSCSLDGVVNVEPIYEVIDTSVYPQPRAALLGARQFDADGPLTCEEVVVTDDGEIVDPVIYYNSLPIYYQQGFVFNGDGGSDTETTPKGNEKLSITHCDLMGADIWGGNGNSTVSVFQSSLRNWCSFGSGEGNSLFQSIGSEYLGGLSISGGNGRDRFVSTGDGLDSSSLWTSGFESVMVR